MTNTVFLTVDDVVAIHALQIARFGGSAGLRDEQLLDSAVAQPRASFDGNYVHTDVFEMAAAYLFHLTSNHPFVDGNKRVGLAAALVFLALNDVEILHGTDGLYELTMSVARGEYAKGDIARELRSLSKSSRAD